MAYCFSFDNDFKVSASELNALYECPRKWFYRYICKLDKPKDYIVLGRCFHEYLEGKKAEDIDLAGLPTGADDYRWWIEKMGNNFWENVPQSSVKKSELWVESYGYKGKIDKIQTNGDSWYIMEVKTAAQISEEKLNMLASDLQLTGYVAHAAEVASELGLDPAKFGGVSYVQCRKPKKGTKDLNRWQAETLVQFVPSSLFSEAKRNWYMQKDMGTMLMDMAMAKYRKRNNAMDIPICSRNCIGSFGPCDYFDECHTQKANPPMVRIPGENLRSEHAPAPTAQPTQSATQEADEWL
jgi:ATP-dependent helicase/DNAse subunit B